MRGNFFRFENKWIDFQSDFGVHNQTFESTPNLEKIMAEPKNHNDNRLLMQCQLGHTMSVDIIANTANYYDYDYDYSYSGQGYHTINAQL